jgi:hypothetical protein
MMTVMGVFMVLIIVHELEEKEETKLFPLFLTERGTRKKRSFY